MKKYYRALTIAGSDSGGGAGIQADLKTFSALGCYGMSVITAVTAQNTFDVTGIEELSASIISKQISAVLDDIGVDAVKTGMLFNKNIIKIVASELLTRKISNIVVDPVMISKSGADLLKQDSVQCLKKYLLPLADIVTPNIPEAQLLANYKIKNKNDMETAARIIMSYGVKSVLVKGGHSTNKLSQDCLCVKNNYGDYDIYWIDSPRIKTKNTHGTGCTISSAIAAHLAKGFNITDAVIKSKQYIYEAINAGRDYKIGKGYGPVKHFYNLWKD